MPVVRALMALRANVLAKGFSGIRARDARRAHRAAQRRRAPARARRAARSARAATSRRSRIWRSCSSARARRDSDSEVVTDATPESSGADALARAGLRPVTLAPKEGLALINGTQASTADARARRARRRAPRARRRHRRGDVGRRAARLVSPLRGAHPRRPAGPRPGRVGRQSLAAGPGQRHQRSRTRTAARCRTPTRCAARRRCTARRAKPSASRAGSPRSKPTPPPTTRWSSPTPATSSPAATSTARRSRSPPTRSTIGLAQLATISERRTDRLMTPHESGLPPFLVRDSGLNSGLMMAHVTAAALTSEIKTLAHPAAVDTIPTSAGREDHVSMSMGAALKAARVVELADARARDRAARRVPGHRSARAAHDVRRRSQPCTRAIRRGRADARRRSSAGARHRAHRRADHIGRARARVRSINLV